MDHRDDDDRGVLRVQPSGGRAAFRHREAEASHDPLVREALESFRFGSDARVQCFSGRPSPWEHSRSASLEMSRKSTLPKRLQPMLATLTDAPFDDPDWVFEDKYDGFRMVAEIRGGRVALYSRNVKIISHSYVEVAQALESVKGDVVVDGELVAIGKDGNSHFQLLQNALKHEAKPLYCAFDLMFVDGEDLRKLPLLERKERLKAILPRHKLIAFSRHRKADGKQFFAGGRKERP
ncbi:ATP-dependent DNA ligase [Bradyrhizobium sp. USDA 4452]